MVRVAVDAMGGDNAPGEIVKGCLEALKQSAEVKILLCGKPEVLEQELAGQSYPAERLETVPASEVIETGDSPVVSVRKKKDSSLVVGMKLIREERADAFVSAGNSGAILVGGQVLVGRLPGVERAPFAPLLPTEDGGATLLLDSGANVDAKAPHLVQFAQMGSLYMERALGIRSPRVAILNVGLEEEKGNALVKETYPLLQATPGINFIGSIEAREVLHGQADVCVAEAFTGNMVLKAIEGTASTFQTIIKRAAMSNLRSKIGAALLKPALKEALKGFDASRYGGAPMLGLRGLVVKVHGNAKAAEVCNAVLQCETFHRENILQSIAEAVNVGER